MQERIRAWMHEHTEEAVQFLSALVQEASLSGQEAEAQRQVADKLATLGLTVDTWEPGGEELIRHPYFCSPRQLFSGSPNVVGVWKGTGGGRSLILNGHVDVVPPGDTSRWTDDPYSGKVADGRVYGRGTTDMKGGNVSLLLAIQCLKELGVQLKGDVIFQSVIEEESGGAGTLATVLRGYTADAAIIPEPTGMKIFPKQQGSMWFRIRVRGWAAHGGTRYEGVSAIEKSLLVIEAVRSLEQKRNETINDPLYAATPIPIPINIGKISGGDWPSSVPDLVVLEGRMGVAPEEELDAARRCLADALMRIEDDWLRDSPPELEWFGAQWVPSSLETEHELMNCLVDAYRNVTKEEPVVEAAPWGTDGGLLAKVGGTPAVVFGPGTTALAHYPDEHIEIARMMTCAEVIALAVLQWCREEK
ncbi:peptidase [Aneurinibacillus uraniidurans]|uniref:peptidase n=1 Tax=Aneurinibacillus uraniidurans TaxID=2966586 RepID=UPI0023493FA3|nr:peptidase [Aneurinibacillus sp. B1]WCN37549.1 peptidase [Aneurinibacillus sp. B1]